LPSAAAEAPCRRNNQPHRSVPSTPEAARPHFGNRVDILHRHHGADAPKIQTVLELRLRDAPTNADIARLSAENPGYRFERDVDGTLVVSPTGSMSGLWNARLNAALSRWNEQLLEPGFCFDSSTGFTLPNGSLISPDGAWIARERWLGLSDEERYDYAPIVPDIVVEIISKTDRPATVRSKLEKCRALGASYVALLDPFREEQWSDGSSPEGLNLTLDIIR
jgi:Uma2 family endonuclease